MKKSLFIALIPVLLLAGCKSKSSTGGMSHKTYTYTFEDGLPTVYAPEGDGSFTTYLMMSRYGYLEIEGVVTAGTTVEEKFYENCITWKTSADGLLPSADQVKSYVSGATFRGWAQYNGNVYPEYLTSVPSASGMCVYAIFDGTDAGQGGGGSVTPTGDTVTYLVNSFPNWIPDDDAAVFAWAWGGDAGNGKWYTITLSHDGVNHAYTNVTGTFEAPNNITGFNMARCAAGTTSPDWTVTGDNPGRVYNKTGDVRTSTGVTTYSSPDWVEYSYQA